MKYILNNRVVEASQFVDDISCMYMEDDWGLVYCEAVAFHGRQGRHMLTPNGPVKVNVGDWIVKNLDDTFLVISDDEFSKTATLVKVEKSPSHEIARMSKLSQMNISTTPPSEYLEIKHSDILGKETEWFMKAAKEFKCLLVFADRSDLTVSGKKKKFTDLSYEDLLGSVEPYNVASIFEFRESGVVYRIKNRSTGSWTTVKSKGE